MKFSSATFLILLFTASFSFAVSRVGGGKIQSTTSGFEMTVDNSFQVADIKSDAVRCLGPLGMIQRGANTSFGTQFFEVAEFANEFSDARALSSDELIKRFTKSNWILLSSQSCRVIMKLRTESAIAYLVTWGAGKGFVMKGTSTLQTDQAMQESLETLKISGGCSWK